MKASSSTSDLDSFPSHIPKNFTPTITSPSSIITFPLLDYSYQHINILKVLPSKTNLPWFQNLLQHHSISLSPLHKFSGFSRSLYNDCSLFLTSHSLLSLLLSSLDFSHQDRLSRLLMISMFPKLIVNSHYLKWPLGWTVNSWQDSFLLKYFFSWTSFNISLSWFSYSFTEPLCQNHLLISPLWLNL